MHGKQLSSPCLTLRLFGAMEAQLDTAPLSLTYNKSRLLLAYLALEPGRAHSRDTLATLFWPERPDSKARTNLRQVLADLRQALGDDRHPEPFLLIRREAVQLNPAGTVPMWIWLSSLPYLICAPPTVTATVLAAPPVPPALNRPWRSIRAMCWPGCRATKA
jgi:hypothetical protein